MALLRVESNVSTQKTYFVGCLFWILAALHICLLAYLVAVYISQGTPWSHIWWHLNLILWRIFAPSSLSSLKTTIMAIYTKKESFFGKNANLLPSIRDGYADAAMLVACRLIREYSFRVGSKNLMSAHFLPIFSQKWVKNRSKICKKSF